MKQGRSGGYVRDGVPVEMMASSSNTHSDILEQACKTFTLSGAVIPTSDDWSLGSYLKKSHRSEACIGIGYIDVSIKLYDTIHDCLCFLLICF